MVSDILVLILNLELLHPVFSLCPVLEEKEQLSGHLAGRQGEPTTWL